MFMKGAEKVTGGKGYVTAYVKGYDAAMNHKRKCPYKNKAGGIAYGRRWKMGYKDGMSERTRK